MKVAELEPGMLLRPVQGMEWVARRLEGCYNLCVEPNTIAALLPVSRHNLYMGTNPVLYVCEMNWNERRKNASVSESWGAQIVFVEGKMMSVDSFAWRRIESALNE